MARRIVPIIIEAVRYCRRTPLRCVLMVFCVAVSVAGASGSVVYVRTTAAQVSQTVAALGADVLVVAPRIGVVARGRGLDSGKAQTLDVTEFHELSRVLMPLAEVSATRSLSLLVKAGAVSRNATSVVGVSANFAAIRSLRVTDGRLLLPEDVSGLSRVAVLGASVARDLFGRDSPLGQRIYINRVAFVVVGVLSEIGQSVDGGATDLCILVPLDVALRRLSNSSYLSSVVIRINAEAQEDSIEQQIRNVLGKRHHVLGRAPVDYELLRERDIRAGALATARKLQAYAASVGVVVLVVGALGVFAIQTLGLAERRREFGVRRALGATTYDLSAQLLTESSLLCLLGAMCALAMLPTSVGWAGLTQGIRTSAESPWLFCAALLSFAINAICSVWPLLREARRPPREALASG